MRKKKQSAITLFKRLAELHPTPFQVQKLIRSLAYNQERHRPTLNSAHQTWKRKRAHCLEAALLAAAILEHRGYPALILSLESQDLLDHVLFLFKEKTGWGAIGRSRDDGLHGRAPLFRNIRELVASYFDPFVDATGKVTGYAVVELDESRVRWRDAKSSIWKLERFLIDLKHRKITMDTRRYRELLADYRLGKPLRRHKSWW